MPNSNIIMYVTEDGLTKIETTFENDTVWLSIDQMAELFQRNKSTISRHIKNIFDELLSRIRDIRSSEKVFWRKILEIYATSIDYDPKAESSIMFFKQIQNKMHWAAHKHTAAEVIYQRADAEKENMGLTSWQGQGIRKKDVEIAKNYLSENEIDALNKIVTAYLDIAEVQALNHEPMYMQDWLETIDDYLRMTRRDILDTKLKVLSG